MKISIIIPVYNVEAYIMDCLQSVVAQKYSKNIECIIVDDCTPDNCCAIIERFIGEYSGNVEFKLLHHNVNRGLSAARNTGIDAATGEYIYFLDSDDEITPDCIELLTTPLQNVKYDFVIGDYTIVGHRQFPKLMLENGTALKGEEICNSYFSTKWYAMAWNKLCNLDFIKKERLYFKEGLTHEDELWSFQLACTAQSMYAIKKETYKYKIRETSIMGSLITEKSIKANSLITNEAKEWAKNKGILYNKDVFKKILSYRERVLVAILKQGNGALYLKHYTMLRISPWEAYKNKAIKGRSLIKEFYNYLPGLLGLWYLTLYNFVFRR